MVMTMNKKEFIKSLSSRTNLSEANAILVNTILENNFFISKKNKDKIISEIVIQLGINIDEATNIYNTSIEIINEEIKNKLKHIRQICSSFDITKRTFDKFFFCYY